jgi:hypothetical protein
MNSTSLYYKVKKAHYDGLGELHYDTSKHHDDTTKHH